MSLPPIPRPIIKGRVYHKPTGKSYAYGCNPAAIRRAAAKNYDGIDLDIRINAAGTAWCFHQANPTKRDGWTDPKRRINDRTPITRMSDTECARLRFKGQPAMSAVTAARICKSNGLIPCFEVKGMDRRFESVAWWREFREDMERVGVVPIVMSLPGAGGVGARKLKAAHDAGLLTMWLWRNTASGRKIPAFVDLVKSHKGKGGIYRKSKTPIGGSTPKPAPKPVPAPPKEPAVVYLTDLPDAIRKAGLKVVEQPGWRTRGHGSFKSIESIICHHTAGPKTGNMPSLNVVTHGRAGLSGPLCNLGLGRDGTVYVIAAGVAYHAGSVDSALHDNWHAIGIEAEATGVTTWPKVQVDAYARLCRALCDHYRVPVSRVLGHKEIAVPRGRKIDPNFDMAAFRDRVAQAHNTEDWFDMASKADLKDAIREVIEEELGDVVVVPPNETASYKEGAKNKQGEVKVQLTSALTRMWRKLIEIEEKA